ncbi:hypothetical protein CRE_24767 [Caenorhabditis remanei]|uniref:F-box domain-containing protein n=1 Tax=Caenorhabditis remanei TaxID=31234 RepID=E3NCT2_CAERE|nr:hypothetical protein CRE_24767 [Caenorhabditis remanei]
MPLLFNYTLHLSISETSRILPHTVYHHSFRSFIVITTALMTTSFPLLNLPPEAISHVLKSMGYGEITSLSFLSKRAKQSVEAMELKSRGVLVQIGDLVNIVVPVGESYWRWSFHGDETENGTINRALPDKLTELSIHHGPIEWSMEDLSVKKWISHFKTIFHFSKFYSLQFSTDSLPYDIEEIKTTFGNFDKLLISIDNITNEAYDFLLKYFPSRSLVLDDNVFECLEHPEEVLIQNYDELEITLDEDLDESVLILDDLLMMNSKTVVLGDVNWTGKEVNQFIKHWMKGSNPRLETLDIFSIGKAFNRTVALKGIRYMEMPADHVRRFKTLDHEKFEVEGGYDIIRHDGTTATVTFDYDEEFDTDSFYMYVWHPHCVGDT